MAPATAAQQDATPAAGGAQGGADATAAAAPQSFFDRIFPVVRMLLIWYLIQTVTSGSNPLTRIKEALNPPSADPIGTAAAPSVALHAHTLGDVGSDAVAHAQQSSDKLQQQRRIKTFRNAFQPGDPISVRVYVSPDAQFQFDSMHEQEQLRWWLKDIRYDPAGNPSDADGVWTTHLNVTVDAHLLSNGSLYAHVFVVKDGFSPNPADAAYARTSAVYRSIELTTFRPRDLITKKRNLLTSLQDDDNVDSESTTTTESTITTTDENDAVDPDSFVAYWKPALTINVVHDTTVYSSQLKPPPFLAPAMDVDAETQLYAPVLYLNDFWVLEEHLLQVNATAATLPLALTFYPLHLYKFALYTQMTQNFENQIATGTSTRRDTDKMKAMVIETNPILLGVTIGVSLLHSLFDFLAFKNDVSFWKNQKSLAGLSLRSVVLNTFFQLVIFLYLLDNDTSWMILMSSGVALVIECWKIKKAIRVTRDADTNRLVIAGAASYTDSPTAEHDRVAVAHLSYVLYPLIVGHAVYTLAYGVHKGWYSWVVSSLTSFVYAFGFIMMTPQLYINYKLQSVAHLPWRAMVYKSLNTFIDDLFAFVIKMPWMHRLSCFRDDLIFFVYLYQRWKYPVDATRTNEFGQGGVEADATAAGEVPALVEGDASAAAAATVDATESVNSADSTEYLMTKRSKTLQASVHNVD